MKQLLRGIRKPEKTFRWDGLTVTEAKVEAADKKRRELIRAKGKPESFRLRYTGAETPAPTGVRIHLVPLPGKNLHVHMTDVQIQKDVCPTCRQIHTVKTVHLWLDQNNTCLVSRGVKESIEKDYPGGLAAAELKVDGGTEAPPALRVGKGKTRREIDQENESIQHWSN